ncbi:HET-domain-containing protein, partial [Amniculicola lignicola CBS 123094]
MEPGPPHQYQPLQSAKHIRIIILEPSIDPTSPLVFSFDQDNLTNLAGQYEALSYTWGVPNLVLPLHCLDGSQVCVTENLDRFLRRLRLKIDKKWLWADAACINQADGAEKAVQIPLMVDIFRGAKGVLAWLGSGENGGEEAVRRLVQLSRCNVNSSVQDSVDQGMSFDSADFKTTMSVLINLPWFKRMWIIQEVVFNQDVTLICGTAEMSWVRFFASLNAFKRLLGDHYVFDHIQRIVSLWLRHSIVHELQHSAHEEGIMELMTTFGQYHCSDERDRIYALFS